jgi:hypothetical protein
MLWHPASLGNINATQSLIYGISPFSGFLSACKGYAAA